MEHDCNYPYKTMSIWYGDTALKYFQDKKYQELTQGLIHELCHALTFPLFDNAQARYVTEETLKNENERLTDHIANIIIKL